MPSQLCISNFHGKAMNIVTFHEKSYSSTLTVCTLENTASLLLAPAKGFGLRPRFFFLPFDKKKIIMIFWQILGNFGFQ